MRSRGEERLGLLADGGAVRDEAQDTELDVARIARDGDEVALAAVGARGQRGNELLGARDGDGAGRLEHGARVLEAIAHRRADLVVAHLEGEWGASGGRVGGEWASVGVSGVVGWGNWI